MKNEINAQKEAYNYILKYYMYACMCVHNYVDKTIRECKFCYVFNNEYWNEQQCVIKYNY